MPAVFNTNIINIIYQKPLALGAIMHSPITIMQKTSMALCCLLLMPISAMATSTAPVKKISDAIKPALNNEQQLASHFPSEEVLWLEHESGKFLALKRDYLAATHHGVAILISDVSAPINYTIDIEPLRTNINQYGWSTLAINAPKVTLLNTAQEPATDSKATTVQESEKAESVKSMNGESPYAAALISRVISAQKWAATRSKNVILIIQGKQVAYLINALTQQHLHPVKAIVLLDAAGAVMSQKEQSYPTSFTQLSTELSQLKMPLLDIYHMKNQRTDSIMATRKKMSMKEKQKNYRQYLKSTYSKEQQLAKVVYGWLKKLDKR